MPEKKPDRPPAVDIFEILTETEGKGKKKRRDELLAPLGIEQFFVDGKVTINRKTCRGLECKLCIKACPTNALYWKAGEVGFTEELCIYCGACVLSCIVDDCIKISRRRASGKVEVFSKPKDFTALEHNINTRKRMDRIQEAFPTTEDYIKQYPNPKHEPAKETSHPRSEAKTRRQR